MSTGGDVQPQGTGGQAVGPAQPSIPPPTDVIVRLETPGARRKLYDVTLKQAPATPDLASLRNVTPKEKHKAPKEDQEGIIPPAEYTRHYTSGALLELHVRNSLNAPCSKVKVRLRSGQPTAVHHRRYGANDELDFRDGGTVPPYEDGTHRIILKIRRAGRRHVAVFTIASDSGLANMLVDDVPHDFQRVPAPPGHTYYVTVVASTDMLQQDGNEQVERCSVKVESGMIWEPEADIRPDLERRHLHNAVDGSQIVR